MAPELLSGEYGPKVDVWSLGVITFMLLSSSMPFYGKDRSHVIKKIVRGKYHFSSRRWRQVSKDAHKFVSQMLEVSPAARPSAEEALSLSWLGRDFDSHGYAQEVDLMDNVQAALQAFGEYSKLKKLALMIVGKYSYNDTRLIQQVQNNAFSPHTLFSVAYKSTAEEVGFLRKMFRQFDLGKDGEITYEEFRQVMKDKYDYDEEELVRIFHGIDVDGTGKVHYSEFLAATIEAHGSIDEDRLAEAFDRLDSDDTGYITVSDLQALLGDDIPTEYLEEVIEEVDMNHDHKISYEEFLDLWNVDDDNLLRETKTKVESRRMSRASSRVSESSMASPTGSDRDLLSASLPRMDPTVGTGTLHFSKQKAISLRGGWV
jgi:calcium-dependent protein kinase